jgi:hypothetical protein
LESEKKLSNHLGSVRLRKIDTVIVCAFSGQIDTQLALFFKTSVKEFIDEYAGQPWAYLSYADKFETSTDDALESLAAAYGHSAK